MKEGDKEQTLFGYVVARSDECCGLLVDTSLNFSAGTLLELNILDEIGGLLA
ncbi:hypothetical protein Lser_V15G36913 [Lactuca serriola]